jgi:hypothetical protein
MQVAVVAFQGFDGVCAHGFASFIAPLVHSAQMNRCRMLLPPFLCAWRPHRVQRLRVLSRSKSLDGRSSRRGASISSASARTRQ